ncbi:hypothetical protein Tco_0238929 [Tanacetum coccineum]
MADHSWIELMQDELNQFERLQVWELVPRPEGKNIIALKWLWKCSISSMSYGQTPQRDVDHAGCKDDCKSTSRGLQFLGENLMSWSSKKQDCTAMSTAEAEYVSLSACCAQVI